MKSTAYRAATTMLAPSLVTRIDPGTVRVVVEVGGRTREAVLGVGEEIVVGSDPACAVCIDDPTVSRHHLRLQGGVAGVRVVDDGSTNGTWYEGARVRDVVVPFVAGLVLGAARLRLALKVIRFGGQFSYAVCCLAAS